MTRSARTPIQYTWETNTPWMNDREGPPCYKQTLVFIKSSIHLGKLGFQPNRQGRQEIPGMILQSLVVKT